MKRDKLNNGLGEGKGREEGQQSIVGKEKM